MSTIAWVRRGVVVLSVAAVTVLGATGAQAAVTSHITAGYSSSTGHFHGKVTSGNAECVAHRTVKLFKETASGNVLVGTTSAKRGGGWTIDVMHAHGKYFAKTPTQKEMGVTCDRAKSKIVDVM